MNPLSTFHRVLLNTLLASVTTSFLWFALTFWVYLETRSVVATSIVTGLFMLIASLTGTVFGTIVDAHRKRTAMLASSLVTLVAYLAAGAVFATVPPQALVDIGGAWFWVFAVLILAGGVAGQLRGIALATTVTLLVPEDRRDRANGLVGTVQGLAHVVTSVFSGLSVGLVGMAGTMVIALGLTAVALGHLLTIRIQEDRPERAGGIRWAPDIHGALSSIRSVPGLFAMILFTTFNNLIMGVYMALMDPYGLTLFSVEGWGVVLGVTGLGFMVGAGLVARFGLGAKPLRMLLLVNVATALTGIASAFREWQSLLVVGMFGFMLLIPVAEAAEQTILQRVVPFERQGRVFGLAQSVEMASAPVSTFLVGPLAQFFLIPFMTTDTGRAAFGWLLGDGEARGIALGFVAASSVMLVVILLAFSSRAYRRLTASFEQASSRSTPGEPVPTDGGLPEPATV